MQPVMLGAASIPGMCDDRKSRQGRWCRHLATTQGSQLSHLACPPAQQPLQTSRRLPRLHLRCNLDSLHRVCCHVPSLPCYRIHLLLQQPPVSYILTCAQNL